MWFSVGDKLSFCKYYCSMFLTFTMKGDAKFQLEARENKDIYISCYLFEIIYIYTHYFQSKVIVPEFSPHTSGGRVGAGVWESCSGGKFQRDLGWRTGKSCHTQKWEAITWKCDRQPQGGGQRSVCRQTVPAHRTPGETPRMLPPTLSELAV